METKRLTTYIRGAAAKLLSAVEIDKHSSNQHEFAITVPMLDFMGVPAGRDVLPATYIYFPADGSEAVMEESTATFYDVRANQPHRNAEYRLYYPAALEAIENAVQGDLLVIARPSQEERVLVIIAAQGAPEEHQLAHLFGFEQPRERFQAIGPDELDRQSRTLDYTARYILDALGIETDESLPDDEKYLQEMVTRFDGAFPTTREFSSWARSTVGGTIDPLTDPDTALMAWVEREEHLFRLFERHQLQKTLRDELCHGGEVDVDRFISISLSVHNRRKSRAGRSLELHVEACLKAHGITGTMGGITENKSRPDFLFPSVEAYHDSNFPAEKLTMLAVKSTLKDRWRQILAEADRIKRKHLLTLEPGISANQLQEMRSADVKLVVPRSLHDAYGPAGAGQLQSLKDFTAELKQN